MSTISCQHEDEYQFSGNQSDDDTYSTGGDSGFSMGHDEDDKLNLKKKEEKKQQQQEPPTSTLVLEEEETSSPPALSTAPNFFSRLASIPIIQDSFTGAQNLVRQHAVGQKALTYAETKLQTVVVSAQPYLPSEENNLISRANSLGNKSLDILERRFPSISSPTNQLVQPITGRIESAVSHLRETKSTKVDPRIDSIAIGFESLLDQYLSAEDDDEQDSITEEPQQEKHGMDRLMHVISILSTRASKKISKKASATIDEERQIKQLIRTWVLEQANTMKQQPTAFKAKLFYENSPMQIIYDFGQIEFFKLRQELKKQNISHMDRIRNIMVLSQTDILVPLYQKSRSIIWAADGGDSKIQQEEPSVIPAA